MEVKSFNPQFMRIGVLTAALQELTPRELRDADPDRAIEDWAAFARELGADNVQLSAALHPSEADVPAEAMLDPVANTLDLREPFNEERARRVLAALLHAAALGGMAMRDVLVWVADPDAASAEVQRLLRRSSEPSYEADALQFLTTNERTRSSICATIMPALGWLTDSTAAAAADAGDFDVARLLAERGTVYMLGAEDAQTAPLVTALTVQ